MVKKFGEFHGIDSGSEVGVIELLVDKVPPNPMAIRVVAFENDPGDPDQTAKQIQDEVVKLSQQASSLASAADAADGPGVVRRRQRVRWEASLRGPWARWSPLAS